MNYIVAVSLEEATTFAQNRGWTPDQWLAVLSPSDLDGVNGATIWVVAMSIPDYPMTPEMLNAIVAARA